MMDNREIMVSICCLVYNHEKYLRKCLEGIVNQKTNFNYEVIIHDDASTDLSPEIIKEYEKKYPAIIKPIYQKENQYSKKININSTYQYPRVTGKYIAYCEGDDYWSDELKLQKQFNALEKHPECIFSTHKVRCISENGKKLHRCIPLKRIRGFLHNNTIDSYDLMYLLSSALPFQLSSYFIRFDEIKEYDNIQPEYTNYTSAGDYKIMLFLSSRGKCYYFDDEMSCYRMNSVGSWTQRTGSSKEKTLNHWCSLKLMYKSFDKYTNGKYHNLMIEACQSADMYLHIANENYKGISKKYKIAFTKLPLVTKVLYYTFSAFPFLRKYYLKIRTKI